VFTITSFEHAAFLTIKHHWGCKCAWVTQPNSLSALGLVPAMWL